MDHSLLQKSSIDYPVANLSHEVRNAVGLLAIGWDRQIETVSSESDSFPYYAT